MSIVAHILYFFLCAAPIAMAGWFGPSSGACSCCSGTCECVPGGGDPDYTACDDYPASKIVKFDGLLDSSGCDSGVCVDLDLTNIVLDGGAVGTCEEHTYTLDLTGATNCSVDKTFSLHPTCDFDAEDPEWYWLLEFNNTGIPGALHAWTTDNIAEDGTCLGADTFNESITYNTEFDLFGTPTWPDPPACELASCTAEIIS